MAPCARHRCMEVHQGKAPRPYETEYCLEEMVLYRDCRDDLKAAATAASPRPPQQPR